MNVSGVGEGGATNVNTPRPRSPRMRRALALLVPLALLAAGCVSAPPEETDAERAAAGVFVDPIVEDHEHADPAQHAFAPYNVERLGHSALGGDGAEFSHFGEMDFVGDLMVVAATRLPDQQPSLVTVDVSDPSNLTRLGWASVPVKPPQNAAYPLDVKLDEKGEFAYVSVNAQILAYDVRDAAAPRLAGVMTPPGLACHMSAIGVVDGVEYFWCTGDPTGLTAYRVVEAGDRRALVPVSQSRPDGFYRPVTNAGTGGVVGAPHDMTFQHDPVDGTPLLVVSNRGYGVRVLDVSDPVLPRQLGAWTGEGAQTTVLHMHTAMVTVVDGTRYLIGSPEILVDGEPPAIWILDATDYADLKLVAEWIAPGAHPSPGFTFTTHQWQVADGRLYLAYYHAGVWVLDLRAILAGAYADDPARPDVLGYYLPDEPSVETGQMVPNVWDLNLKAGVVYATDISSGLYALHYLSDPLGDETLTGFS